MTSLKFPDTGTRLVVLPSGAPAVGRVGTLYSNAAGTLLAEVYADVAGVKDALIADAKVTLDAYGQQPDYWGPVDGTDRLWITVNGGPLVPVDADYNARIDAAVAGGETPTGAQAKADAAQAAAIAASATDATTKANAAAAASLPLAGGAIAGDLTVGNASGNRKLVVKVNGAPDLASLPNGITGQAAAGGLFLLGSFTGGEDDGTGNDTTAHINSYHYQRAAIGSYGESLRQYLMLADAKASIAWWFPTAGYNAATEAPNGSAYKPQAWVIAHSKANDNLTYHNHLSFETMSPSNGLITRLEIPFVDQETWQPGDPFTGVATANIRTSDADFSVRAASGVLRVGGSNAYNKDILLSISSDRAATGERWKIRANTDTEAGSSLGTNFELRRHGDNGAYLGTAMFAARNSGRVGFGYAGASGGAVSVVWSDTGAHGFYAKPSTTPGNSAAFASLLTVVTDRIHDHRITGDASARLVQYADGKMEFGDGTTRDTNLYRNGADQLRTDDTLIAPTVAGTDASGGNLQLHSTTHATKGKILLGSVSAYDGANGRLGINQTTPTARLHAETAGAENGLLVKATAAGTATIAVVAVETSATGKRAVDYRVTGDSVSRFRIDTSAGSGSGTVTFGDGTTADTNLYRSAAAVLSTDASFTVGSNFRHFGTGLGFYSSASATKQAVTGSRGGNAALASLLTALATVGLITDSTTA